MKKIEYEDLWVEVEGDLDMDGFMHGKEGVRPGFQEIRHTIHIKTTENASKVKEFKNFVESRCPVTDTLNTGTQLTPEKIVIE